MYYLVSAFVLTSFREDYYAISWSEFNHSPSQLPKVPLCNIQMILD